MNKFDKLYIYLMEMMTAGGLGSVLGSPSSGPIGNTGGAFPGGADSYATGSNVMPTSIFGGVVNKRNLNFNKEPKKHRKSKSKK